MLRMIRGIVRVDLDDLKLELGIQGGAWLLGEIIQAVIVLVSVFGKGDVERVPAAGTAAAVYGAAGCMIIVNVARFVVEYQLHLRFPLTRRGALAGHLISMLAHDAILGAGALVWGGVGAVLHPLLYDRTGLTILPTFAHTPWFAWLILLLAPLPVALLAGGIISRFGRAGGWLLYMLFMVVCLSLDQIIEFFENFGVHTNAWTLLAVGALGLAVLLALCVRWLLKAAVQA